MIKNPSLGTSLAVQWLRLLLTGTQVRSLIAELRSHVPTVGPKKEGGKNPCLVTQGLK